MRVINKIGLALAGSSAALVLIVNLVHEKHAADAQAERERKAQLLDLATQTSENRARRERATLAPGEIFYIKIETGELYTAKSSQSWCLTVDLEGGAWGDGCNNGERFRFATPEDAAQARADHDASNAQRTLQFTRSRLAMCRTDLTNGQLEKLDLDQVTALLDACNAARPAFLGKL